MWTYVLKTGFVWFWCFCFLLNFSDLFLVYFSYFLWAFFVFKCVHIIIYIWFLYCLFCGFFLLVCVFCFILVGLFFFMSFHFIIVVFIVIIITRFNAYLYSDERKIVWIWVDGKEEIILEGTGMGGHGLMCYLVSLCISCCHVRKKIHHS